MHSHLSKPPRPSAPRNSCLRSGLRTALLSLSLGLSLGLAVPLAAQANAPAAGDLQALLYYLETNDQRAVQAEMRRLRAQFPGWTPPDNLDALRALGQQAGAGVDVAPIWARIERDDFSGARRLIDQARRNSPGWTPDAEMLRVLELNEAQAGFDSAVARGDHAAAIAAARRTPGLMRCDAINNAWQLAEMYHAAGQTANALATYRGVLGSCSRMQDLEPTLEKANEIATVAQMTELFEVARAAAPANAQRLDTLEERLRAGRGGGAPAAARTARPAQTAQTPPAEPAPSTGTERATAAAAAPLRSLPVSGDNRLSRVRTQKESGNWAACLAASTNPRSLDVLYERSWCAYNLDRAGEALAGFTAAANAGRALGAEVPRDARFGMMLTYVTLNMIEEAARLAANTDLNRSQRVEIESMILDQRAVRAFQQREYAQALSYLNALESLGGALRRDLAMLRGYAHLNLNQVEEAHAEFTRLHGELATDETRSALQTTRGMMLVEG